MHNGRTSTNGIADGLRQAPAQLQSLDTLSLALVCLSLTRTYLRHLGLPEVLSNQVHAKWESQLSTRLAVVEGEARGVLRSTV